MKKILQWWLNINTKTRLISIIILMISLLMSSLTFYILVNIDHTSIYTHSLFCKDFSLLLSNNIINLIEQNNNEELKSFVEKIYLTTSSIRYIQLLDSESDTFLFFPVYDLIFQNIIYLNKDIWFYDSKFFLFNSIPVISYFASAHDSLINVVIPLMKNSSSLGVLKIGFNLNTGIFYASQLIRDLSLIIFVAIWLIFMLGIAFNSLIFNEPTEQLLQGLRNIAMGNFNYKIQVPYNSRWRGLLVSFNDMSERLQSYEKKNVDQLTSEKAKLETLVSTIADGALLLDIELRLLFVNQIAIKVFHWSNRDLIGTVIFHHLPLHVNKVLLPILNRMVENNYLDNDILQTQDVSVNLNYESVKTFRFLLTAVLDHRKNNLNGIVITIQDITRETQLNEAKNQFISNVSHELRTPLCNIGSFLETLIDYSHKLSSSQKHQFLTIAYTETRRLNRLVNDVLDLSRLEAESSYMLTTIKLTSTVIYIMQLYQIIALNKSNQIVLEVSNLITTVMTHENSFCQILSNLISNALKFTHAGGKVVIRSYPLFDQHSQRFNSNTGFKSIRIEVIDEGIGIDKMFCRQIFDRFMRIENYIHTLEGTGLGLSIVKNIIEKYNSRIVVYSEIGIGTSFWFDLLIAN